MFKYRYRHRIIWCLKGTKCIWHLIIIQRCPKNMCGELMFPNWKCPGFHHRLLHVWAVDRETHHMMDLLNQVMRQVLVQCRYVHHFGCGSFGALVSSYLSTSIYLWGGCFYWLVFPMIITWGTWPPSLNILKVRQALRVDKSVSLLATCSCNLQQL